MNERMYDVILRGTGPAGLQSAIHTARRKVSVLVLGKFRKSSAFGAHIGNYCGIDGDVGADPLKGGYEKACKAGMEFLEEDVTALTETDGSFTVALGKAEKLKQSEITLHGGRRVTEIIAANAMEGIVLDDGSRIELTGIFIVLGAKGAVDLAAALGVTPDAETMKDIATNKKQETNLAGIYAAGDICGPPWQVAKAVGEGCVAGLEAAAYAKKQKTLDQASS